MCDDKPVIHNEGDVKGSEQYGIRSSGTIGNNSSVTQSISRTTNTQYNVANTDSHDDNSQHTTNQLYHDEYNVSTNYSMSDSHDSYISTDSHDAYMSISNDSHNVTNMSASFTSARQAAIYGMFFGNPEWVVIAIAALAVSVVYFIGTILVILDVAAVAGLVSLAGYGAFKHTQGKAALNAHNSQQEAQRVFLREQREHELELARLSRPVYLTMRNEQGYMVDGMATPALLEDNYSTPIEFGAEKVPVLANRGASRTDKNYVAAQE